MSGRTVAKLVHWALLVTAVVTVVSGLGITEYQAVGTLTFGLLNKASAFKLHLWAWMPFLVLLATHVLLAMRRERFRDRR
jgi:thiosulfate reductase cytochrome b subunit